jgi:long-chain acyl-CoA synthetase
MSFNHAVILREAALKTPDKVAVVLASHRLTYAQLEEMSNRVAAGLRDSGVRVGDRVALMLPNIPQFLIAYFAILKAGAVMVPMNVLLKAPEVAHQVRDSGAVAMIVFDGVAAEAAKGIAEVDPALPTYVVSTGMGVAPEGARAFEALLAGDAAFDMEPTTPEDTALLLYTSGTTGRPKGAELTHFQLYMACDVAGRLFGVREDDVFLVVLPLFHVFGLSAVANVGIRFNATLVLVPRFDAGAVLEVIQADRVTVFGGVPTMFIALLQHPELDRFDLSSLRTSVSGGASIPGEVIRQFEERFKITVLEGYGLSETAAVATFNRSAQERKVLSVGKPIWGVEVRIAGDDGNALPPGSDNVGEILIRGHNVMKGYHNRAEETAAAFAGGWFHTGDMGYRDDDGFVFIVDRKKELIIRGGYNVYPREVEEVLYAHPAVAEAAVIGVAHDRLGEEVAAVVVVRQGHVLTEVELIAYCKERMAAYKYPRSVRFTDSLPKGATGKVLKKELRASEVPATS